MKTNVLALLACSLISFVASASTLPDSLVGEWKGNLDEQNLQIDIYNDGTVNGVNGHGHVEDGSITADGKLFRFKAVYISGSCNEFSCDWAVKYPIGQFILVGKNRLILLGKKTDRYDHGATTGYFWADFTRGSE